MAELLLYELRDLPAVLGLTLNEVLDAWRLDLLSAPFGMTPHGFPYWQREQLDAGEAPRLRAEVREWIALEDLIVSGAGGEARQ